MTAGTEKNQQGQFTPRLIPKTDELTALEAFKKLGASTKESGENKEFVDGDLSFLPLERAFILKCLDREWGISDLETKVELEKKLNASE